MVQADDRRRLTVEPLKDYAPQAARALWRLEDTRRRTLRTLEGVSNQALDWPPPYDPSNSIGTLLYHLAAIEADWLLGEILELEPWPDEITGLFPQDVRDDEGVLVAITGVGLDGHLDRLGAVRRFLLGALHDMTEQDFRRPRELETYDATPEWVLHHLIQHETEHRGQIGELRLAARLSP